MKEMDFTQSMNAREWAHAFVTYVKQNPGIPTDEETMVGWFANAIMRGWDERGQLIKKQAVPGQWVVKDDHFTMKQAPHIERWIADAVKENERKHNPTNSSQEYVSIACTSGLCYSCAYGGGCHCWCHKQSIPEQSPYDPTNEVGNNPVNSSYESAACFYGKHNQCKEYDKTFGFMCRCDCHKQESRE